MEPADFYGVRGAGLTSLRRELGWLPGDPHPLEESLTRAIGAGLLHLDDPDRLRAAASPTGGVTEPFRCLGFARYESHEGERPMAGGHSRVAAGAADPGGVDTGDGVGGLRPARLVGKPSRRP